MITIAAETEEGVVAVSVTDTGTGMSEQMLSKLFERFACAKDGANTSTGLGLYICKHIIEEHGGSIDIQSKPGRGTVVRFTIPIIEV